MFSTPRPAGTAPGATPATPATTPAATPAPATPKRKALASDFETFLKMLTTQMKNQDPLKPLDSAEFAAQLATFSGVEQQVKTNSLLAGMTAQFGVMGMSQLAAWVGQEARAAGPVWLNGGPRTLSLKPEAGADRLVLTVKDGQGRLVAREDVPRGTTQMNWQARDAKGAALAPGLYTLDLESYRGETRLATSPVESYRPILEARTGTDGPLLVLQGGVEVAATKVTALRRQAPAP